MTLLNPGGAVAARRGALMCAAPSPIPLMVNASLRIRPDAPAEDILDAADEFFAARGRGYTLHVHETDTDLESLAVEQGLLPIVERYPQMVCRRAPADRPGATRVNESITAAAYWDICRAAYPSLGIDAAAFDGFADALLLEPHIGAFIVADDHGESAACAMATLGHGIASVWWVACLPAAARRRTRRISHRRRHPLGARARSRRRFAASIIDGRGDVSGARLRRPRQLPALPAADGTEGAGSHSSGSLPGHDQRMT